MTTLTIKVNKRNKAGRTFLDLLEVFRTQKNAIEIVEKEKGKSPYSPEFVKKIKDAEKQIREGKYTEIDPKNVWGSLGL